MKRSLWAIIAAVMVIGVMSEAAFASVKVKFVANTATISDTLTAASKLTVTGNNAAITGWGDGISLTNIGGDYWSTEVMFNTGDTVYYKYRANGGWESNLSAPLNSNNRELIVGANDTTLQVEFYNGTSGTKPQYWRPYPATASDSLTVWIRVNMQAVVENKTFGWTDADKDSVVVMGDNAGATADLDWGTSHYLTQESNPYFYSARIRFAKSAVTEGKVINYKYRLGNNWGRDELQGKSNRTFTIPVGFSDTTIYYVYYDDTKPVVRTNEDTCVVTFSVDMAKATTGRGFSQGDTVIVRSGYFKTGAEDGKMKQLELLIGTQYEVTDTIVTSVGKMLDYQYYVVKNGVEVRENYFNFYYDGITNSERERRQFLVPSKQFTITDAGTSPSDARRQPEFPSQKPLSKDVTVKWIVDLRPAYAKVKAGGQLKDIQGDITVLSTDSIKVWGAAMNGPATNLPYVYPVGDWATWNRDMVADTNKRKMWDDGTHGDQFANDTLYSLELTYPSGSASGRVYKFTIGGGDNEAGNDQGFGNNHNANISDVNSTATIYTEWGSINATYYSEWNYTGQNPLGVASNNPSVPVQFAVQQNYPNPFNPTTKIDFSIPARSNVSLVVYNVIGQQVATLVNETMETGFHTVNFNASSLSSGIYFYKLTAGNFSSVKKMMLLK